jgi:hypothetical protein
VAAVIESANNCTPLLIDCLMPFGGQMLKVFGEDSGYHRAFRYLRAGVLCLPAVIVRARTLDQIGAARPWFFPEEALFSSVPPRVIDFLDDALVIEYRRPPLIKTLRVTVEESYTVRGENL